ncbi:MAG TPA: DUF6350 family protein [Humibacter sp.]|nr:DUF6350 family protein [Humibacter sp.]
MNRLTVALLAALDAVIVVAIGIGVALVPLTVMWAVQFHLDVDWTVFWRAGADAWLLGHGADLAVTLPATTVAALGAGGAAMSFPITIAALGIALFVVLMGARTGARAAGTSYRITGAVSAIVAYAVLAAVITFTAGSPVARPSAWQGVLLPPFVFAVGVLLGLGIGITRARGNAPAASASHTTSTTHATHGASGYAASPYAPPAATVPSERADHDTPLGALNRLRPATRVAIVAACRGGAAATAMLLGASAAVVAVSIAAHYAQLVALYESLQAGVLGATAVTVAQLALLPNAVVWAASWLAGPGFALGTGSSVSPVGTVVGPVPAVPLLGILPHGSSALAFAGLVVPVLAGFAAGYLTRSRSLRGVATHAGRLTLVAVGIGCFAGVIVGLLAWSSSGSLGPGRLQDAGPNGWLVGLAVGVEVAAGALVGAFSAHRRS